MVKISEKIKSGKITDIKPGTLPLLEWQQFEEIKGDRTCLSNLADNNFSYDKLV
jgi:hypothetical protein